MTRDVDPDAIRDVTAEEHVGDPRLDGHPDGTAQSEQLMRSFPGTPAPEVLDELLRARAAAVEFGLDAAESLDVAEAIVRHLMQRQAGETDGVARLDGAPHRDR